jgi:hypothetical protein
MGASLLVGINHFVVPRGNTSILVDDRVIFIGPASAIRHSLRRIELSKKNSGLSLLSGGSAKPDSLERDLYPTPTPLALIC